MLSLPPPLPPPKVSELENELVLDLEEPPDQKLSSLPLEEEDRELEALCQVLGSLADCGGVSTWCCCTVEVTCCIVRLPRTKPVSTELRFRSLSYRRP